MAAGTIGQLRDLISLIKNSDITRIHFNEGSYMQKPFNKKMAEATIEISITNNKFVGTEFQERNVTLFVREMDKNIIKCQILYDNIGWALTGTSADKIALHELLIRIEDLSGEMMPPLFYKFIEGGK
jgi:hypothetical protein